MPRGLRQWLNLQFVAILEIIENGLHVGENLMITTKFVNPKTQPVKLSAYILKSWGGKGRSDTQTGQKLLDGI